MNERKLTNAPIYFITSTNSRACEGVTHSLNPWGFGVVSLKKRFFFKFMNVDVPWVYRQLHAVFTCDISPNLKEGVTHRISLNSTTTHIFNQALLTILRCV